MSTDKRFPKRVYSVGTEPDPRFTLANERTFLAWIRTSLAVLAAGVAIEAFELGKNVAVRQFSAILLIVAGAVMAIFAFIRWMGIERAMREAKPLPSLRSGLGLAVFVAIAAVVTAMLFNI